MNIKTSTRLEFSFTLPGVARESSGRIGGNGTEPWQLDRELGSENHYSRKADREEYDHWWLLGNEKRGGTQEGHDGGPAQTV